MSKKGNILLVANWESGVGYAWWLMENFWVSIASHFEKDEIDCYLAYPKITRIPESITSSRIITHEHDFRDRSLLNLYRLNGFIRRHTIEFIYLSDSPAYSMYYVLLRLWGIRRIVIHDHTPGDRTKPTALKRILKQAIQRMPLITADHFIGVSEFVRNRLIEVNRIPPEKCTAASNGIIPFDLKEADPDYARNKFSIPDNKLIIVSTGRATYYKGIDLIIACADQLINREGLEQLHFLFCGDGPDLDDFKSTVERYKLGSNFTFAGKRSDIRQILPSCDIGFHASHGEVGYSLSILEFMSAGLATIVPNHPSTCSATINAITGLVYPANDVIAASACIKQCISKQFRQHLSTNAIRAVISEYNIADTNRILLSTLERVFK